MRHLWLRTLAILTLALPAVVLSAGTTTAAAPAAPDARIAVVRGGDLYLLDAASGALTQLTTDHEAGPPSWSPAGSTLLFEDGYPGDTSSGEWSWTAADGLRRLGPSDRVYSDDGTVTEQTKPFGDPGVLSDPRQATYVTATVGGRTGIVTPQEPGVRWLGLGWSPDDRTLALQRSVVPPSAPLPKDAGDVYHASLWVTTGDPLDGQRRQLQMPPSFNNQPGIVDRSSWSPDGRCLVAGVGPPSPCNSCVDSGLPYYAVPIDGAAPISLGEGFGFSPYSWAADASFVVMSGPLGREPADHKRLLRTDLPSGTQRALAEDASAVDVEPAVSPDGRTVAFARGVAAPMAAGSAPQIAALASRRIWLVNADGSNPRALTPMDTTADDAPAWTPDGRWVIYVRWQPSAGDAPRPVELWAVPAAGGEPRRIVDGVGPPGDTTAAGYISGLGTYFAVQPGLHVAAFGTGGPRPLDLRIAVFALAGTLLLAAGLALRRYDTRQRGR